MLYIDHTQDALDAFYMERITDWGALCAEIVHDHQKGRERWSEPMLIHIALELMKSEGDMEEEYHELFIDTNWEMLLWEAICAKDKEATEVCIRYTGLQVKNPKKKGLFARLFQ